MAVGCGVRVGAGVGVSVGAAVGDGVCVGATVGDGAGVGVSVGAAVGDGAGVGARGVAAAGMDAVSTGPGDGASATGRGDGVCAGVCVDAAGAESPSQAAKSAAASATIPMTARTSPPYFAVWLILPFGFLRIQVSFIIQRWRGAGVARLGANVDGFWLTAYIYQISSKTNADERLPIKDDPDES